VDVSRGRLALSLSSNKAEGLASAESRG